MKDIKYRQVFTGDAGLFGQVETIPVLDHFATGQKAKELREAHHLTQREVAKEMGLSAMFLSQLERGKCRWTEDHICNYANAVGHITTFESKKESKP